MRLPLAFLDMQLRGHSVLYMKQLEIFASLFFCLLMLLLLLISKPSRLMHLVAQAFYTFVIFVSSSLFLCVHMADLELGRSAMGSIVISADKTAPLPSPKPWARSIARSSWDFLFIYVNLCYYYLVQPSSM